MATIVAFHAHPDDESIGMGGTIARAVDEGHRVVLVFATRGDLGEVPEGFLGEDELLAERRVRETAASAAVLGAHRVVFLGYRDSGMEGTEGNEHHESFWQAPVGEAAERLAALLREEEAEVLTVYDENGNYGHPDHIQVHRVGVAAAEAAGTPHVLEMTINRDHVRQAMAAARASGVELPPEEVPDLDGELTFGMPEALITTTVDVRPWLGRKRASMRAHASQIHESSFFLTMPEETFEHAFGQEWFIRRGVPVGHRDDWLFPVGWVQTT